MVAFEDYRIMERVSCFRAENLSRSDDFDDEGALEDHEALPGYEEGQMDLAVVRV